MSKSISRRLVPACLRGFVAAVALSAGCWRTASGPARQIINPNNFNGGWCDWGPAPHVEGMGIVPTTDR